MAESLTKIDSNAGFFDSIAVTRFRPMFVFMLMQQMGAMIPKDSGAKLTADLLDHLADCTAPSV